MNTLFYFAMFASAIPAGAGIVKIRELQIPGKHDRSVRFEVAITPGGDLLSVVMKNPGDWQFYRVRSWAGDQPEIQSLVLPGYVSEPTDLRSLNAKIWTTADGAYAIVNGTAPKGLSQKITVIDLATFKIVGAIYTKNLDFLDSMDMEYVEYDSDSRLVVSGDSFSDGVQKRGALSRLALPSLTAGPVCAYNWTIPEAGKSRVAQSADRCREAIGTGSIDAYFDRLYRRTCDVSFNMCSADGKFAFAYRSSGHDTLFGWTQTKSSYAIYSSKGLIGEIPLSQHDSSEVTLASIDGLDYLLLIMNGSRLVVYQLQD